MLTRSEIASLLSLKDYIRGIEEAFKMHAQGRSLATGLLHIDSNDVEFHIKAGGLRLGRTYFALKVNGSSFQNRERYHLPNIMGAIILFDGHNGYPLAVMDSIEITIQRTGAATAVAAKYLARTDANTATIFGCGNQGRIQLKALKEILPLEQVYAFDLNRYAAEKYALEMAQELSIRVTPEADLDQAVASSDVVVTCTPARKAVLHKAWVRPGTFIAAVGADSPDKQELETSLLRGNKVVVDILAQCAQVGELHHALEAGLMVQEDVHGELADVITGKVTGRTSDEEITIYDATGTALQDVAGAALCYEKAMDLGKGAWVDLQQ